ASSGALSIGDHPAILPATTPAMAAAGPNTEFERVRRRDRDSGVAGDGDGELEPLSGTGVPGIEFSRVREPLRDLASNSWGCCSLCFRFFNRPPRIFLMKVSWSLISSKA